MRRGHQKSLRTRRDRRGRSARLIRRSEAPDLAAGASGGRRGLASSHGRGRAREMHGSLEADRYVGQSRSRAPSRRSLGACAVCVLVRISGAASVLNPRLRRSRRKIRLSLVWGSRDPCPMSSLTDKLRGPHPPSSLLSELSGALSGLSVI